MRAGQPVLAIAATGKQWLSFNAREDFLRGLTVGTTVEVARAGTRETIPAVVTELRPLGAFATWQAERAVGIRGQLHGDAREVGGRSRLVAERDGDGAGVVGDLPRVSRAIRTVPREAARTRRACGIRTR